LGQQKTVQVLKLVMHDSIEEQVVTMGRRKRRLFDLLITPGEQMPDKLTEQDVLMLFGQE
jgi:SNF2 family DNA or RNA helicase